MLSGWEGLPPACGRGSPRPPSSGHAPHTFHHLLGEGCRTEEDMGQWPIDPWHNEDGKITHTHT